MGVGVGAVVADTGAGAGVVVAAGAAVVVLVGAELVSVAD